MRTHYHTHLASHLFLMVLVAPFLFLALCACAKDKEEGTDFSKIERELAQAGTDAALNGKDLLPVGQGHLRVLAIGNSFTEDALRNVRTILDSLHVNDNTYSVYGVAHSAASLQHWAEVADSNEVIKIRKWAGKDMKVIEGTLAEILAQNWDVIVLLQYSGLSTDYATFKPWLGKLKNLIYLNCPNANVRVAWQMAWSYIDYKMNNYTNHERWLLIASAVHSLARNHDVDILIPVGTAIQNARNTSLNDEGQLTRDGWHLSLGVAQYIAACTVVQQLFAPVYDITIQDDDSEITFYANSTSQYPPIPVTDDNRHLCHQCAMNAISHPYVISF